MMMMSKASAFAAFLLVQNSSFSAAQRQKGTSGLKRPVRHLDYYENEEPVYGTARAGFTSFFEIEYATLFERTDDVDEAAQALATAYNKLIAEFDDPSERRMGQVSVLSASTGRRLTKEELRELQDPTDTNSIFVTLNSEGTGLFDGSCGSTCVSDFTFSDQTTGPGRKLPGKGKGKGKSTSTSIDQPMLKPGLPTEEEIRIAYSDEIQSMYLDNIVDVVALDEVDKKGPGKGSGKGKGKGSKKTSKKGSGKGSGKGKGKGSKKSCKKGKGKGYSKPEGIPVEFTSFFRSMFGLVENSSVGLEAGARALATAYNRVLEDFESDSQMDTVFLFDNDMGRRLSWEEVRELQGFNFNQILEADGFCTDCGGQFTLSDQLTNRKLKGGKGKGKGKGKGEPCLRPGLPTEEEVRLEYNIELEQIENVESAIEFEEIERPPPPGKGKAGKGKGKNGTSKGNNGRRRKTRF